MSQDIFLDRQTNYHIFGDKQTKINQLKLRTKLTRHAAVLLHPPPRTLCTHAHGLNTKSQSTKHPARTRIGTYRAPLGAREASALLDSRCERFS